MKILWIYVLISYGDWNENFDLILIWFDIFIYVIFAATLYICRYTCGA